MDAFEAFDPFNYQTYSMHMCSPEFDITRLELNPKLRFSVLQSYAEFKIFLPTLFHNFGHNTRSKGRYWGTANVNFMITHTYAKTIKYNRLSTPTQSVVYYFLSKITIYKN